ncbi:hypothetical protein GKE82_18005 [Conexibacter sp. W3-3-2]|uniref:hypothetical protein n=1 Tax=Conexibacter sp. W3-3-2 TaxID=2675227 RepID=UPI0012B9CF9A|nr:hypothetical protein [Conexibacter sp. W3-3-2]MTD46126.1 hypothetical protein [Conexibacter sp. W3-3-2]
MPGAERDITSTLSELERKLEDLESELAAAGEPVVPPPPTPAAVTPPPAVAPSVPNGSLDDLRAQLAELERFRDSLESSTRALIDEYRLLLAQRPAPTPAPILTTPSDLPPIGGGWSPSAPVPTTPVVPPAPPTPPVSTVVPLPTPEPAVPSAPPPLAPVVPEPADPVAHIPAPAPPASVPPPSFSPPPGDAVAADPTVQGQLTLDAGPFADIATLSSFEQALGRLPGAQDVYVKGFEGNRALIDLQLAGPIALATRLREVSPLPVTVREPVPGAARIQVDVEEITGA